MSDLDGLLTILLAESDDAVAYAAIADLLEEDGRDDEAHFVRSLHVIKSKARVRKTYNEPPWVEYVDTDSYSIGYFPQYQGTGDYKPDVNRVPKELALQWDTFEQAVEKMALFTVYCLNHPLALSIMNRKRFKPYEEIGRRMAEDVERRILGTT